MSKINDLNYILCTFSKLFADRVSCTVKFGKKIYMSGEVFFMLLRFFRGGGVPILFRGVELGASAQDHSSFHIFMANN